MDELKDPRMYKDFILDQLLEEEEEYLELECYYESMDIAEVEQDIADFFKTLEWRSWEWLSCITNYSIYTKVMRMIV